MKKAAKGFEWEETVLPALAERIKAENDAAWVTAHLSHSPRTDPTLFAHLPQPEAERIARDLTDVAAAAHCPGPWGERLSRRVLGELRKALRDWYRKGERWPPLQPVALALHPSLADEADELREIPGAAWSVGDFCDLVSLRAAMLRELP